MLAASCIGDYHPAPKCWFMQPHLEGLLAPLSTVIDKQGARRTSQSPSRRRVDNFGLRHRSVSCWAGKRSSGHKVWSFYLTALPWKETRIFQLPTLCVSVTMGFPLPSVSRLTTSPQSRVVAPRARFAARGRPKRRRDDNDSLGCWEQLRKNQIGERA